MMVAYARPLTYHVVSGSLCNGKAYSLVVHLYVIQLEARFGHPDMASAGV